MKPRPKLKVAILPKLGIFYINVTTEGNLVVIGGYESELLRMLLNYLGLPNELLVPEDGEWGFEKNGSWTGLIGMVARREVDIAVGAIYLTEERIGDTDTSYPYHHEEVTFATRHPAEIHSPATFAYPFNTTLWISVLLITLIFSLILKLCLYQKHANNQLLFGVIGSILRQPISLESSTLTNRLLLSLWIWFGFIITLCYSSVLLSFLTFALKETGIKELQSLSNAVRNGKMKVFLAEGSSFTPLMLTHTDPHVKLLEEYITKNNWYLKTEPQIVSNHILKELNAMIGPSSLLRYLLGNDIFIPNDALFTFPLTILLKKNSELTGRVNEFVHRITSAGIYKKNVKDYVFRKQNVLKPEGEVEESTKTITLDLEKLQGAFIVLVIGLGLATFVFGIEVLYFKFKRSRKKQCSVSNIRGSEITVNRDM